MAAICRNCGEHWYEHCKNCSACPGQSCEGWCGTDDE